VVGVGEGIGGEVEGEGDGVTVCTDGPAFVVSPSPVGVLLGKNIRINTTATAAARMRGRSALPAKTEGFLALRLWSTGWMRGSIEFLHCFGLEQHRSPQGSALLASS
jgi:hypothetical protein